MPEYQQPADVPSCLVAKSVLLQRIKKLQLPANFLDELGESQHLCRNSNRG